MLRWCWSAFDNNADDSEDSFGCCCCRSNFRFNLRDDLKAGEPSSRGFLALVAFSGMPVRLEIVSEQQEEATDEEEEFLTARELRSCLVEGEKSLARL